MDEPLLYVNDDDRKDISFNTKNGEVTFDKVKKTSENVVSSLKLPFEYFDILNLTNNYQEPSDGEIRKISIERLKALRDGKVLSAASCPGKDANQLKDFINLLFHVLKSWAWNRVHNNLTFLDFTQEHNLLTKERVAHLKEFLNPNNDKEINELIDDYAKYGYTVSFYNAPTDPGPAIVCGTRKNAPTGFWYMPGLDIKEGQGSNLVAARDLELTIGTMSRDHKASIVIMDGVDTKALKASTEKLYSIIEQQHQDLEQAIRDHVSGRDKEDVSLLKRSELKDKISSKEYRQIALGLAKEGKLWLFNEYTTENSPQNEDEKKFYLDCQKLLMKAYIDSGQSQKIIMPHGSVITSAVKEEFGNEIEMECNLKPNIQSTIIDQVTIGIDDNEKSMLK